MVGMAAPRSLETHESLSFSQPTGCKAGISEISMPKRFYAQLSLPFPEVPGVFVLFPSLIEQTK